MSCFAGAISIESNLEKLRRAGFSQAQVAPTGADLNVYREGGAAGCCAPKPVEESGQCCAPAPQTKSSCCGSSAADTGGFHDRLNQSLNDLDLNAYAAAVRIFALKP